MLSSDAIAGLIGVALGGGISGGFEVYRDRSANSRDARAARRLVHSELTAHAAALAEVVRTNVCPPLLLDELDIRTQFDTYCDRLARTVPVNIWNRIDWVYWNQRTLRVRIEAGGARPDALAQPLLFHARAAIKALEGLDKGLSAGGVADG